MLGTNLKYHGKQDPSSHERLSTLIFGVLESLPRDVLEDGQIVGRTVECIFTVREPNAAGDQMHSVWASRSIQLVMF